MMNIKKHPYNLHKSFSTLLLCLLGIICTSCSMLNTPVRDFFENSETYNNRDINADSNKDGDDNNHGDTNIDDDGGDDSGGESETTGPGVFYVSATGKSDATGTKTDPFDSFDKAFTALKNSLETDTTLTSGKIYLSSNIEITEEIDLSAYAFADIGRVCDITIAGDDENEKRTIDAKSNCRVLQIGYTNGSVTVENLILTGGTTTDGQGGAGLFISSNTPSDVNSCKIIVKNCSITQNNSPYKAGGIYLKTGYVVEITDCEISDNTSTGAGAAGIEMKKCDTSSIIQNTKIINNTVNATGLSAGDLNFGIAINVTQIANIKNLTITGNTLNGYSGTALSSVAALHPTSFMYISGKNTIYDNLINSVQRNIVLNGSVLIARDNLTGSKIGVTLIDKTPTTTTPVVFLGGYTSDDVSIFVSDCEWAIKKTTSGVAFSVSGGGFTDPLGITMSFAASPLTVNSEASTDTVITVTPTVTKDSENITSSVLSDITWELILSYDGSTSLITSSTNTLTIPAMQLLPDSYVLYIKATLNGIAYSDSVTVTCQ